MTTRSKPAPRRFTPLEILNRAAEYGIRIMLDGENLRVDVLAELPDDKKTKALAVIEASSLEIITYFKSFQDKYLQDHSGGPALCCTCLDEDRETPALPEDYEGIMYCADHHPNHKPVESAERSTS